MIIKCDCCGKEFDRPKNKVNEAIKNGLKQYCCKECLSIGRSTKIKCQCAHCGKELFKLPSEIKRSKTGNVFCDKSCACSYNNTQFRRGENNPNWRGGTDKSTQYAKDAFRYYKHECTICSFSIESALEVHHIDQDRNNGDLDNLIILCANCHNQIHYGSLKVTTETKLNRQVLNS